MKLKKRAIIESLDSVANLYGKEMEAEAALLMLGNALQLNRAAEAVKSELQEATKDRNRSFKTECRWNFLFPPLSPTLRLEGKA